MTFFQYLDHRYRTLNIELQKEYRLAPEGELKAAYSLIQTQRAFFKYLHIPILISKFFLIKLRVLKGIEEPQPKEIEDEANVVVSSSIQ